MANRLVLTAWTDNEGATWEFDVRAPIAFDTYQEARVVTDGRGMHVDLNALVLAVKCSCMEFAEERRQRNIAHKARQSFEARERDRLYMTKKQYDRYKRTLAATEESS